MGSDLHPGKASRRGRRTINRGPTLRQEFVQLGDRMIGDARENIAEPGERVHFHQFARSDEASQDRRGLAAAVAAEKGPVGTAHGKAAQSSLGGVVIDGEIWILTVARQRGPVL